MGGTIRWYSSPPWLTHFEARKTSLYKSETTIRFKQHVKQSTAEDNLRNLAVARFHIFMPIAILLVLTINFQ